MTMETRAHIFELPLDPKELQIRIDVPSKVEPAKGAETHDPAVQVPWPLPATTLIDYHLGNPWLSAIGNLLADSVAGAEWELLTRVVDTNGELITRTDGWTKESDEDYARAKAWLGRETIGGDGVSDLDLPGVLKVLAEVYDQTGNIFVEIVRNRSATEPLQIRHLLPQFVWYRAHQDKLELYQVDPHRGEFSFVPFGERAAGDQTQREFLHQRSPNTASSFYGLPEWIGARDSVEVDNEHRKYLRGFFKRHGAPRWMIHITQDPGWTGAQPSSEQVDEVYQLVQNYLSANAGDMAGRNLLLQYPGGILVRIDALDTKLEDPIFPQSSKQARDEIMAVRHISLLNLGLPEGGYRATAEQQAADFEKNVLQPFAAPVVAIINRILHAPAPSGLGITTWDFHLNFNAVERTLERIKGITEAVGGPVLSQVEGRAILGYEPAGEDKPFLPGNMLPTLDFGAGGPDAEE